MYYWIKRPFLNLLIVLSMTATPFVGHAVTGNVGQDRSVDELARGGRSYYFHSRPYYRDRRYYRGRPNRNYYYRGYYPRRNYYYRRPYQRDPYYYYYGPRRGVYFNVGVG